MLSRMKFEIEDLVAEILDQLPSSVWTSETTTFFDPAIGGGQFVREIESRLRAAGHTESNIHKRVFGFEESALHIRFAVNKHKLIGQYVKKPYDKFLEMDNTMKFDVVVGNPPYQDSDDSGGALWSKFVNKIFNDIAKSDGYVAMIHPPSFIGKHQAAGKGKSDYTVFAKNQIEQIHILDDYNRNKHFSGVGTRICWYIAKNSPITKDTTIVGYDGDSTFSVNKDFSKVTFLPNSINSLSMAIHDKLISVKPLEFKQRRELHYYTMKLRNEVTDTKTKDYPFKSYFSHKIIRYSNFKFSDYSKIKVMVPQTSTIDNNFVEKDCNVSEDLFYVVCSTITEATEIQKYLKSPLVSYIGKNYRPGRNLGSLLAAGIIPDPTQHIIWTVEELEYIKNETK